jgi:hypothetical protein
MNTYQWYKFSPAQWMMGKITRCDNDAQARFMRLCCLYWTKRGDVDVESAQIELEDSWDRIVKMKIVKIDGDKINIDHLDEQLDEMNEISKKRTASAKKRWNKQSKSNARAMQVHNDAMQDNADKIREDKIREDKKENIPPKSPKGEPRPQSVDDVCEYFEHLGLNGLSRTEAEKFFDHYTANGWKVGRNAMKDWKAACRNWKKSVKLPKKIDYDF